MLQVIGLEQRVVSHLASLMSLHISKHCLISLASAGRARALALDMSVDKRDIGVNRGKTA